MNVTDRQTDDRRTCDSKYPNVRVINEDDDEGRELGYFYCESLESGWSSVYSIGRHLFKIKLSRCLWFYPPSDKGNQGPRCKSTTGCQNQDRSRLSTNHRRSWRGRDRSWNQRTPVQFKSLEFTFRCSKYFSVPVWCVVYLFWEKMGLWLTFGDVPNDSEYVNYLFRSIKVVLFIFRCRWSLRTQDKTRQRDVTDAGTTVPLSPHLQCRYSDDNIHFIQLKTLIDLRFRLGSLSNQT